MKYEDIMKEFSVTVYGNLKQYNQTLSKARCRIFYKYFNRNGTYITDEFAEKLISSLPYTPVKGIYDEFNDDYTDHGKVRSEGRIYGIVPENPNFAWETHPDEDGVDREYACVDVYLFTALYEEAENIVNKAQSMEIYEPSIKGDFKYIEGRKAFVFTDGCFLGLQVLGEEIEPCFEGAAFYTFYDSLKTIVNKLEEYNLNSYNREGGIKNMADMNFKLSDNAKYNMIWNLLNPNYNEAGEYTVDYGICDVYDEYVVAYCYETSEYQRIAYEKNDADDSLALGAKKKCFIVDVTEDEKKALETLQTLNGGTYENIDANYTEAQEKAEKVSEYEQKIIECNESIATLTTEKENIQAEFTTAKENIETLTNDLTTLNNYKLEVENQEKQQIINKYSEQLSEDIINKYKEKVSEYTVADLEKDLAFDFVKSTPSIFTADASSYKIPKDDGEKTGIDAILENYKK